MKRGNVPANADFPPYQSRPFIVCIRGVMQLAGKEKKGAVPHWTLGSGCRIKELRLQIEGNY